MHKIIILFITAILVISAPIDSFAGQVSTSKAKRKTAKQANNKTQKQPVQKKAPIFSYNPFELNGNVIPRGYIGHDLREVYNALKVRSKNRQKREFETTAEFNERMVGMSTEN